MLRLASKALSIARGLASEGTRVESAQRLLAYCLNRLPLEQREEHLQFAEPLSDNALTGSRLYTDRVAMLHALPKGGAGAEVGVDKGIFTQHFGRICQPSRMVLIDRDLSPCREQTYPVEMIEGDSSTILAGMPVNTFDWLYIDGDHSYEGCGKDLAAAHHCLKPGGYLVCNDYTVWCVRSAVPYGVPKAVNEFVNRRGYAVRGLSLDGAGQYDLLIQKPSA